MLTNHLPPDLLAVLASIEDPKLLQIILEDLLSPAETRAVGDRWAIVTLLRQGHSQREVRDQVGVSIATVSRGNRQLLHGTGGLALAMEQRALLERDEEQG